jgi:hypothetical protein
MATIKIQRCTEYNNRRRDYKIFIDGKKVGTIADGETKDFVTSAGQHSIMVKIDWCSSPEISFDINDNNSKTFKVGGNWIIPIAGGVIVLYFILKIFLDIDYALFLLLPPVLLLFYYLTVGRKRYLTLNEIKK